jgi:hypothetical protein
VILQRSSSGLCFNRSYIVVIRKGALKPLIITTVAQLTDRRIADLFALSTYSGSEPCIIRQQWAICERVAEVQALLDDHIAGGKHTAADVVAKAQAILTESELLRAMFDVGCFPPNTPPVECS